MTASAAALAVGSSTASADKNEILQSSAVESLLETVNNPDVVGYENEPVHLDGLKQAGKPMEASRIQTEVGEIIYVDGVEFGGTDGMAHLTFDENNQQQLPHRFRIVPESVEVGITYERGQVNERREALPVETKHVEDAFAARDIEYENISAYYDATLHTFFAAGEEGPYKITLSGHEFDWNISRIQTGSFQAGEIDVIPVLNRDGDDVTTQDHCYSIGGPCAACAAGSGSCGLCGLTCLTGALPVCGACIALSCGAGGVACGCCISCLDGNEYTHECTDYLPP